MKRRDFTRAFGGGLLAGGLLPARGLASVYAGRTKVPADVPALRVDGKEQYLRQRDVQALADRLRAPLLLRDFAGYDEARQVLNPLIDKHPAVIVQPTGVADIASAIQFAAEHRVEVAVKCGGHSFAGKSTCNGGLQIDLSRYRGVRVDPKARSAYVAGGSLLGQIDHESMAYGLVTTTGTVSHTGVGGLTTGGGFGRIARRHGLALDNVSAAEVVAPDGMIYLADKQDNPDLFWGVRGAGSNFGVVSTFRFKLHPMQRKVLGGQLIYPIERARDVLEVFAEYGSRAPRELYIDPIIGYRPAGQGGFAMLDICYIGDPKRAKDALKPLRALGKPSVDSLESVDYVALQRSNDSTEPRAMSTYMKAGYLRSLEPALIDALLDGLQEDPSRYTSAFLQHAGGAISDVAPTATAFPHRYASANLMVMAGYPPGPDVSKHRSYVKQYWSTLEPFTKGFYVNDADDQEAQEFNSNYQGNYGRLKQIKKHYDPDNLFRLNANIS